MKCARIFILGLFSFTVLSIPIMAYAQPPGTIKQIYPEFYRADGLMWKGESMQNTNWSNICEDKKGRIWFSGGDHWGTDREGGIYEDRYERPWGFGNATVHYYNPEEDKTYVAFELDWTSAIYSNAETPGHGKIHADITCDDEGNIWTGGYLGSSYNHEWCQQFYPKSYVGGAIIKYNPETNNIDYYSIPNPGGGLRSVKFNKKLNCIHGVTVDRQRYYRIDLDTMELRHYDIERYNSREIIIDLEGNTWYPNEFGSLTRFDLETGRFTDYDAKIPGLRAAIVTGDGKIYGICPGGFVWCWDMKTNTVEDYGHVVATPEKQIYTTNMALDEEWGRLYFMAGGHGHMLDDMPILTIYDLKEKKFYWVGKVDVDGCFGSIVGRDHTVYFSCYAYAQKDGKRIKNKEGREYLTNYLVKYIPPEYLADLK